MPILKKLALQEEFARMRAVLIPPVQINRVYRIRVRRGGRDCAFPVMVMQVQEGFCRAVSIPAYGDVNPDAAETLPFGHPHMQWEPVALRDWPRCFRVMEARRRHSGGSAAGSAVADDHQAFAV